MNRQHILKLLQKKELCFDDIYYSLKFRNRDNLKMILDNMVNEKILSVSFADIKSHKVLKTKYTIEKGKQEVYKIILENIKEFN